MNKIIRYLKWLFNDGRYILSEGEHCGCCGKWYKRKIMIPTYLYSWGDKWGLCEGCVKSNFLP